MKYKIQFEGDLYEDGSELRELAHLRDIMSAIDEVHEIIRTRLKYSDKPITDEEFEILEKISKCLYIEGLK